MYALWFQVLLFVCGSPRTQHFPQTTTLKISGAVGFGITSLYGERVHRCLSLPKN